jgi:hypothetical protein
MSGKMSEFFEMLPPSGVKKRPDFEIPKSSFIGFFGFVAGWSLWRC